MKYILFFILVTSVLSSSFAQDSRVGTHRTNLVDSKFARNSVVLSLKSKENRNYCSGGLFTIDDRQFVFTNEHCVPDLDRCIDTTFVQDYSQASLREYALEVSGFEVPSSGYLNAQNMPENQVSPVGSVEMPVRLSQRYLTPTTLESNRNPVYNCEKIILTNKIIDLSIIEVKLHDNNLNFPRSIPTLNENDFAREINHENQIASFGHVGGKLLSVDPDCQSLPTLIDDFYTQYNCDIDRGGSGGMVLDINQNKAVGLNSHMIRVQNEDGEEITAFRTPKFINLTPYIDSILSIIRGDDANSDLVGNWSPNQTKWVQLKHGVVFDVNFYFKVPEMILEKESEDIERVSALIKRVIEVSPYSTKEMANWTIPILAFTGSRADYRVHAHIDNSDMISISDDTSEIIRKINYIKLRQENK